MSYKNLVGAGFYILDQVDINGELDPELFSFMGPFKTLEAAQMEIIKKNYIGVTICDKDEINRMWEFLENNTK